MMKDAWDHYVAKAWGENELKPLSEIGQPGNHFGGAKVGCTIVDSLDTLFIMELMDEYNMARDFVAHDLDWAVVCCVCKSDLFYCFSKTKVFF